MEEERQPITTTPLYGLVLFYTVQHTSALAESHRAIKILLEQALAYNAIFQRISKLNNRHRAIHTGIY
jgi:hypothetical protein